MCSSHHVSYKSSLHMKALMQSSLLLPIGTVRQGSHGTVMREDDSSHSITPASHTEQAALLLVSLTEALKRQQKGWWMLQEGSDSSRAVFLMADKSLAASGEGKI